MLVLVIVVLVGDDVAVSGAVVVVGLVEVVSGVARIFPFSGHVLPLATSALVDIPSAPASWNSYLLEVYSRRSRAVTVVAPMKYLLLYWLSWPL